jgi:hypothetical protein
MRKSMAVLENSFSVVQGDDDRFIGIEDPQGIGFLM